MVWKVEVEGGVSVHQNAYRKQKSCTQSLVRVVNSITQSRKEGEHVALVVLDYESCYEKVWRAGLLKKAYDLGINGRLWVYIKNFLDKRIFSLKVNDFSSEWITSTIGIPQGSVISPILCNVYTSDAMESINSQHADFADDVSLWKGDTEPKEIERVINKDLESISEWCKKWNMSIASEKTDVLLFQPQNTNDRINIQMNGSQILPVRSKRVLGVTIDENLNFCEHIERKRQSSLSALRAIDMLFESGKGCSQSVYMRLYKTISLPIMEYACPVLVTAHDKCVKEFSKVQRHAMLQATGCMKSTSNNMLEILTNTIPIDIHLRLRQAQEVVRIAGKHENDPLYDEFIKFLGKTRTSGKSNTTFELLMSRFWEFKTNFDLENIEKEFRYTEDSIGLCRTPGKLNLEECKNTKETQERNIRELLNTYQNDTLIFTDGSALGNPGPTGAGAAIFLDGQNSDPIMLKTPVSKASNNFHGELMGIHLVLDFIQSIELDQKPIHIFTDCQAALTSVFGADIPSCKIALILQTREIASNIKHRGYELLAHWIPGHVGIAGNELADKLAKEAAVDSKELEEEVSGLLDKREIINQMKGKAKEKWQRQHNLNEDTNRTNELFEHVGARDCSFDTDRQNFTIFNQLISGHCMLKAHMSKLDENLSEKCESCGYKEDVEHYMFHCNLYELERANLEKEIEEALKNEENIGVIDENLVLGDREVSKNTRTSITKAVLDYIKSTGRFI